MIQAQNIPTNMKEAVLQELIAKGYWVRALVETHEFIDLLHHPIQSGTVKDANNNYSNWTMYVTHTLAPLNRVVRIRHKYFNLVI